MKIIWLPQAQEDLANQSFKKQEMVLSKTRLLYDFPLLGSPMDQAYEGYRQLLVGNHRIIYQVVTDSRIEIAYLRHQRRQTQLRAVRKKKHK